MATGSTAERLARRTTAEPQVYAGDRAPDDGELDGRDLYGTRDEQATVVVEGVFEAQQTATFELPGETLPVYVHGPSPKGRLGTTVQAGHPWLKAHPELFVPLKLPVDEPWPRLPPPTEVIRYP